MILQIQQPLLGDTPQNKCHRTTGLIKRALPALVAPFTFDSHVNPSRPNIFDLLEKYPTGRMGKRAQRRWTG
jgi:hypothetical protein